MSARTPTRLAYGLLAMLALSTPAGSEGTGDLAFRAGHSRLSISAGYGTNASKDYFVAGLGAGYYFLDGLEAGIDGEAWMGQKPHLYEVSPEVRYILLDVAAFKPYLGAFYRRTIYDDRRGLDSAGGRAGAAFPMSSNTYLSGGLVYEKRFRCDTATYTDCSLIYPEISFSFSY